MPQRGASQVGDMTVQQDVVLGLTNFGSGLNGQGFYPPWSAGTGWKEALKTTVIPNKTGTLDVDIQSKMATSSSSYVCRWRSCVDGVQKAIQQTTTEDTWVSCVLDFEVGVLKGTSYEITLEGGDNNRMSYYRIATDWVFDLVLS